jgi:hypothetical protein
MCGLDGWEALDGDFQLSDLQLFAGSLKGGGGRGLDRCRRTLVAKICCDRVVPLVREAGMTRAEGSSSGDFRVATLSWAWPGPPGDESASHE